jgi:hypothetical protein
MNDKPDGPGNVQWWKPAAVALGAILAGALGWLTGVRADIDGHTRDIQKLQLEVQQQGRQLERIENKIDRLLRSQ